MVISHTPVSADRFAGVLLGTAVGDALGLPAEGLSPQTIAKRWKGAWRHRFVFGRGMVSDDTEHTLLVAQSLLEHPADPEAFQRALAWRLRWWMLCLPAGVGLATARAILKLWLGFPPSRSGVASAGNGPAMRSAVLGVFYARDEKTRFRAVEVSTHLTHTDPRALTAAQAVAEIAAWICGGQADPTPFARLSQLSEDPEWTTIVHGLEQAATERLSVTNYALRLGLAKGVSGYAFHSVPVALYAWWRHRGDYRATLTAALNCGGDTDTVGAIVGALAGADVGAAGIPDSLVHGIVEWPRSVSWMRRLAARLHVQAQAPTASKALPVFWPAILPRNLLFLLVVLVHGFTRLLPR
jgi:ADP-ribosyl-[dinitrogen reductase] hydrolase